eukprot:3850592-Rhodomonas_salina.1
MAFGSFEVTQHRSPLTLGTVVGADCMCPARYTHPTNPPASAPDRALHGRVGRHARVPGRR